MRSRRLLAKDLGMNPKCRKSLKSNSVSISYKAGRHPLLVCLALMEIVFLLWGGAKIAMALHTDVQANILRRKAVIFLRKIRPAFHHCGLLWLALYAG